MYRGLMLAIFFMGGAFIMEAGSAPLFTGGDFSKATERMFPLCRTNGGKVSLYTERGNWNRAAKLEVVALATNKAGHVIANASCWIGSEAGKDGFQVKPNTEYSFEIEMRGTVGRAIVGFIEWTGPDTWKDMKSVKTSVGTVKIQKGWTLYRGTFRTGSNAKRGALNVHLYSSTSYEPLCIKAGDYVLFDNVKVEEKPAKDIAKLARERGAAPYAIAEVPVTSAMALPFLPDELFEPEKESFYLKAAVNERKAFPLAIANLTDAPAEYRIILETQGDKELAKRDIFYRTNGKRGLSGFPSSQIEFRRGVVVRDSDSENAAGLCIDPLPLMDEASVITVPAKSARLVWFDFDTASVAPGKYHGRLRVLPLSERGEWISTGGFNNRRYKGAAKDYPLTLEVVSLVLPKDPPAPAGFFQYALTEEMFDAMLSVGVREMGISPYNFGFVRSPTGTDFNTLSPGAKSELEHVRKILLWAEKRNVKLTWFIGFSAYRTLGDVLMGRKFADRKEHLSQFVEWVGAVKREMNALNIADDSYVIETWDEPEKEYAEEILLAHKALKKVHPTVRLTITLGGQGFPFEQVLKLEPYVDGWTLWDHGYFSRSDHLSFIRRVLGSGRRVSHYTCATGASMMREDRTRAYRRSAWLAQAHGLTRNEFFWFVDAAGGYGAQNWKTAPVAGIFYRSFDGFIPSVRAMAYREGMTDIKYLAALKAKAGDKPEVASFLKEAPMKVVCDEAHDITAAHRMRARIIELAQ